MLVSNNFSDLLKECSYLCWGGRIGLSIVRNNDIMSRFDPSRISWTSPWYPVSLEQGTEIIAELHREISPGHLLFGCAAQAVGRHQSRDDVLLCLGETVPQFAVVHLTYAQETRPEWPYVRLFDTLEAWIEHCQTPDEAHLCSANHRAAILQSEVCGCFYCCSKFSPNEVLEWVDEDNEGQGRTALCPKCGIDAVLPGSVGFELSPEFLTMMRAHWF